MKCSDDFCHWPLLNCSRLQFGLGTLLSMAWWQRHWGINGGINSCSDECELPYTRAKLGKHKWLNWGHLGRTSSPSLYVRQKGKLKGEINHHLYLQPSAGLSGLPAKAMFTCHLQTLLWSLYSEVTEECLISSSPSSPTWLLSSLVSMHMLFLSKNMQKQ